MEDSSSSGSAAGQARPIEQKLRQQIRLYETVLSHTPDLAYIFDLDGRFIYANDALLKMWGRSWDEAIGRNCLELGYEPWHAEMHDREIAQVIKTGKPVRGEVPFTGTNGRRIYDYIFTPVIGEKGEVEAIAGTTRDVTERKLAEDTAKSAAENASLLSAIISSSDDAIISKDMRGFITSWNGSAERIFGYKADEVIGRHITVIIPAERLNEEDRIMTTLREGQRIDHFETWRRHKDGRLVPVSLTVSPVRDHNGHIIGASKISRDISEQMRVQQVIKETNDKKDEFLANMSHELRTPMNAVIGLANILKGMEGLPKQAEKYLDTLKTSADHLMDLINDLLDFSRIEADSFEIDRVEFDLAQQIEKIVSVMNVRVQEKGLNLFINHDSSLNRFFLGDPLRLNQVLTNILSNAIKFTDHGSIEVDIRGHDDRETGLSWMTFRIGDTGIGIPHEKLESIFEKFTQADTSITRRYGGSGLGLAITKACVEKMGGRIAVESQLGLGTIFTVTLPFGVTDRVSNVESFSARTSPMITKDHKNVLLVEDYEPNVLVASAIIEQLGCDYEVASNGVEALRKFIGGRYDIILMDVQMNELDGLEAARRIRKLEREKGLERTPIIAMTAHVRDQDKDRCFEAGMDDFISKPFESVVLSTKISRYIGRPFNKDDAREPDRDGQASGP